MENFDATFLGSGTAGEAAGQESMLIIDVCVVVVGVWRLCIPPVGGVVSSDVSRSVTAGGWTPAGTDGDP